MYTSAGRRMELRVVCRESGNGNYAVGKGAYHQRCISQKEHFGKNRNRKIYSGRDAGRFLPLRSAYLGGGIFSRANLTWLVIGKGESYHCERVDGLPHASLRDKC